MIAIRGFGSSIVSELLPMLPADEVVIRVSRDADNPTVADRHLFCAGVIRPKRGADQTREEIEESTRVNLWSVTDQCERILSSNTAARICIIGSESGFAGSFDDVYAASKSAVHGYVESKRLKSPHQQIVCLAPSIIEDCGMTIRRADHQNLEARRLAHPMRRFLTAQEVATWVHFLLYVDAGYMSNQVIRLNGGEHLWR